MAVEAVVLKKMAVVIGLQSTGEASTSKAMASDEEAEIDEWVSTPQMILLQLIEAQFPGAEEACLRAAFSLTPSQCKWPLSTEETSRRSTPRCSA